MQEFEQEQDRNSAKVSRMPRKNSYFISEESGKSIELILQCRQLLKRDSILRRGSPYVVLKMPCTSSATASSTSSHAPTTNTLHTNPTSTQSSSQNSAVAAAASGNTAMNSSISNASSNRDQASWKEIGRTNVVHDNVNPNFIESFVVGYKFEEYQPILLEVWDQESSRKSEFLGQAECSLGEIVKQSRQVLTLNLSDKSGRVTFDEQKQPRLGRIIIRYEEVFQSNDICMFQVSTEKLQLSRLFLNLFLRIYRKAEAHKDPLLVYESTRSLKSIKHKTIKLKGQKLCNSDYNVPIVFELWNANFFGSQECLGSFEVSVHELREKIDRLRDDDLNTVSYNLRPPKQLKKQKQPSNKSSIPSPQIDPALSSNSFNIGALQFHKTEVIQLPSFLDYIRGGTQINLLLGIDFTSSNGFPEDRQSLHHIDLNQKNQYQRAIKAVGTILMEYDNDKLIPTYGFGAVVDDAVQHSFALNMNKDAPELYGISGVMEEYARFIQNGVQLSGPTYFAPLLESCMRQAQQSLEAKREDYFVLLILTDGMIHDMEQSKRLIVDCAKLPISIIIIGVGEANFADMKVLDGDEGLVDSSGRRAQRDLVQFVAFKDFEDNDFLLQKEVLQELPDQIVEYQLLSRCLPEGFEYQPHINYIEYTRIVSDEPTNLSNKAQSSGGQSSAYKTLIHILVTIAIGIILMNIII